MDRELDGHIRSFRSCAHLLGSFAHSFARASDLRECREDLEGEPALLEVREGRVHVEAVCEVRRHEPLGRKEGRLGRWG